MGSVVAAGVFRVLGRFLALNSNVTILGAVMVLAPGMAISTAIRDLLSGELGSGASGSAVARVFAVAFAAGVAVVLSRGGS